MSDNVYSRSSKSIFDFVTRHLCVQLFKTDQIKSTEVVLFWNIQVKLNHNFKHLQAKRKKCWISALMTTKCHWIFLKLVNILLILWISGNINFDYLIIDNRNIIFSTFIVDNRKIVSTKAQHWFGSTQFLSNSTHFLDKTIFEQSNFCTKQFLDKAILGQRNSWTKQFMDKAK